MSTNKSWSEFDFHLDFEDGKLWLSSFSEQNWTGSKKREKSDFFWSNFGQKWPRNSTLWDYEVRFGGPISQLKTDCRSNCKFDPFLIPMFPYFSKHEKGLRFLDSIGFYIPRIRKIRGFWRIWAEPRPGFRLQRSWFGPKCRISGPFWVGFGRFSAASVWFWSVQSGPNRLQNRQLLRGSSAIRSSAASVRLKSAFGNWPKPDFERSKSEIWGLTTFSCEII